MFVGSIHWCCEVVSGGVDISGNEGIDGHDNGGETIGQGDYLRELSTLVG